MFGDASTPGGAGYETEKMRKPSRNTRDKLTPLGGVAQAFTNGAHHRLKHLNMNLRSADELKRLNMNSRSADCLDRLNVNPQSGDRLQAVDV
jgi:hypothetical protein